MINARSTLIALFSACLVLAVAPVLAHAASEQPVTSQVKLLKKQVKTLKKQSKALKKQVAALAKLAGPQGQPGEAGATGAQGPQGETGPQGPATGPAGGDLIGAFPDPQIAPFAVAGPELALNAISPDTNPYSVSIGNLSSKLAPDSIGRSEIGAGQVRDSDLGEFTTETNEVTVAAKQAAVVSVSCPDGGRLVSGGGTWTLGSAHLTGSRPAGPASWSVSGVNDGNSDLELRAIAICLAD